LELGSVVRFGPNDVSINTATALQEIYGSRKANVIKSDWYSTVQLAEGGLPSTFSIRDRAQHAQKRRLLARAFSESAIRDTEPHILEQVQKWCSILGEGAAKGEWTEGRNMTTFSDYLTFDILSDLCFGKSFDVLEKEENRFVVQLIPSSTSAVYTVSTPPRLV
jgi:cytochrome P450